MAELCGFRGRNPYEGKPYPDTVAGRPVIPYPYSFPHRSIEDGADVRADTPDDLAGPFRGAPSSLERHSGRAFLQPAEQPKIKQLDDNIAEASAGIRRLRLESVKLQQELDSKLESTPPDAKSTRHATQPVWEEFPSAVISTLPRCQRIALLEMGVEAADLEDGWSTWPHRAPPRPGKLTRSLAAEAAAVQQGLLAESPCEAKTMAGVTLVDGSSGLALGAGLGAAVSDLAEQQSVIQRRKEEALRAEWRVRPPLPRNGGESAREVSDASRADTDALDDESWIAQRRMHRRNRLQMRKEESEMHWPVVKHERTEPVWPPLERFAQCIDKAYNLKKSHDCFDSKDTAVPLPRFLTADTRLARLARRGHWSSLLGEAHEKPVHLWGSGSGGPTSLDALAYSDRDALLLKA